jgi:hypothetical protein
LRHYTDGNVPFVRYLLELTGTFGRPEETFLLKGRLRELTRLWSQSKAGHFLSNHRKGLKQLGCRQLSTDIRTYSVDNCDLAARRGFIFSAGLSDKWTWRKCRLHNCAKGIILWTYVHSLHYVSASL